MARNPPKYFPISTVTVLENIVTNVYSTEGQWTEPGSEMQKCIIGIHHIFPSFLWYLVVVLQNISFMRIEKSRFSRWRRNSKVNTSSGSHRKNQTRGDKKQTKNENAHRYEQKCQSHTCSGTINSSMYDSDWTITTSPLTSSAPYSG
jgi:hypothetical protein